MIHVLIVDDEPTTRNSLKEYIPWSTIGVDSVRLAKNGLDALNVTKEYFPNILICDIRMPKMNGMELATNIRKLFPKCKIIFLSGYCDKEYLKGAITLQAVDYIEKPIDMDKVTATVKLAINQYNDEIIKEEKISKLKQTYDECLPFIREHWANDLIFPSVTSELRPELKPFLTENSCFQCATISFSWNEGKTECELEVFASRIIKIPYELLDLSSFLCGFSDMNNFVFIEGLGNEVTGIHEPHATQIFEMIRSLENESFFCSMGIGPVVTESTKISGSYSVAKEAVIQKFYAGENCIYTSSDLISSDFEVSDETFAKFRELLDNRNIPEAIQFIKDFGEKAVVSHCQNIDLVKNIFFNFLIMVNDVSGKFKTFSPQDINATYLWQKFSSVCLLSEIVNLVIMNIEESFENYMYYNHSNIKIYDAIMYIRSNYSDRDLTIKTIADHMYISHTYLCMLFKKSTGKTLNEYITEVRIEKAKEFLQDNRKKLYEVAEQSGFSDPNYFSTIFKRIMGYTPSEYRERVGK